MRSRRGRRSRGRGRHDDEVRAPGEALELKAHGLLDGTRRTRLPDGRVHRPVEMEHGADLVGGEHRPRADHGDLLVVERGPGAAPELE